MKAKKILATVLALMMVISMLPVNALAATPGNTTSNRLKVELSASTTFGTTYDPDTPDDKTDDIVVSTIAEYNELNDNNSPEDIGGATLTASNVATVGDSNIKLADQVFDASKTDVDAKLNDTIYVGVKLRSENMDAAYHGIVAGMVLLKYDPTKLELLATDAKGIARNLAMIGFFNTSTKKADRQGAKDYYCNADISDDSVFGAPGVGEDTGSNVINLTYSFPSGETGRFPLLEKNTWDFVIPFKVKDGSGVNVGDSLTLAVSAGASYNPGSGDTTASTYLESTDIAVDGDTQIVGSSNNMNITAKNNPDNCTLGTANVTFVNKSAPPKENVVWGSVTNVKNKPFITANEARPQANGLYGANDYVTIPAEDDVFAEGDKIYVYADKDGTIELGHTTICAANVAKDSLDGVTDTAWGGTLATDAKAGGKTVRLVPDAEDGSAGTEGYGYITNQDKVWIGRLAKDATANEVVDTGHLVEVTVSGKEDPLYYNADLSEDQYKADFGTELGMNAEKAVSVKLGDTVSTVLDKFDMSKTVMAPNEGVDDVGAQLDWNNMTVEGATGNEGTDQFNVHGAATIKVPFKNATADGTNYAQPTAYCEGTTVPVYGAVIHVKVVPNPADYYITNDKKEDTGTSTTRTLTILGNSKDALKPGDVIKFYADNGGAKGNPLTPNLTLTTTSASEDPESTDPLKLAYTNVGNETTFPKVGETVWIVIARSGNDSEAVPVVVAEAGTYNVVQPDPIGEGADGPVLIDSDATVSGIFNDLKPTFRVSGREEDVPVSMPLTDGNILVQKPDGSWFNPGASEFDTASDKEGDYTITYEIPAGSYEVPAATEGGAAETINYTNSKNYKISVKASVTPRLKIGSDASHTTVTNIVNNPDGSRTPVTSPTDWTIVTAGDDLKEITNWDTFEVTGDKFKMVDIYDPVRVYQGTTSTVVATGYVYEKIENGTTNDYKIKVDQLGRTPGNDLTFRIFDASNPETQCTRNIALGAVDNEPYTFVQLVPYSPDTLTVDNTANTYTDTDAIYAAASTIGLPATADVEYAYKIRKEDGSYEIDNSTKQTVSVNVTSWANGTEFSGNDITQMDGSKASVATLDLTVSEGSFTTAGGDKVVGVTGTLQPTMKIQVVSKAYDGPAMADLVSKTAVTNNRYPEKDKVLVSDETENLTVYFYTSAEDAAANKNAVATFTTGTVTPADVKSASGNEDVLAKNGGTLYFRAKKSDTALSTDTGTVTYGREDYTFWSISIADADKNIEMNRSQITGKADDAAKLSFIKDNLPGLFTIQAVRFISGATGPVADTETANAYKANVTFSDLWKIKGAANVLAETDVSTMVGTAGDTATDLTATVGAEQVNGMTAKIKEGEQIVTVPIEYAVPTEGGITRPTESSTVAAKLTVKDDAPETFELPENVQQYINVANNNSDDYGENTDDSIEFKFITEGADAPTVAEQAMDGVTVSFEINGETITGTIANDASNVPYLKINKDTPNFKGIPAEIEALQITFTKDGQSAKATVTVPGITGATKVNQEMVEAPRELSFFTGMVKDNSQLTGLVSDIETVDVNLDATTTVTVDLTKTSATPADYVAWTLQVDANGDGNWANVADTDWATTLDPETYSATTAYRLTADLDLTKQYDGKTLEKDGEVLAIIPITLYNDTVAGRESFPVKLTTGNNDLYLHGAEAGSLAKKQLDKWAGTAGNTHSTDPDDYKTDMVYYYFVDYYDTMPTTGTIATSVRVKDIIDNGILSFKQGDADPLTGEALTAFLTADTLKVDQYAVNRTTGKLGAISVTLGDQTFETINPHYSDTRTDYMEYNVAGATKRRVEDYIVQYKVTDGKKVYVVNRKVKLTYRPGDADFNGFLQQGDANRLLSAATGAKPIFVPGPDDGEDVRAELTEMQLKMLDYDLNGFAQQSDANQIVAAGSKGDAALRW